MSFTTGLILVLLALLAVAIVWIIISRVRYKKLDSQIDIYISRVKALQGELDGLILQQHETKRIKGKQDEGAKDITNINNDKLGGFVDNLLSNLPRRNRTK